MWSSRLFWKLFLTYAGLVLLAVSACIAIVSAWQDEQLFEQVRRRLHDSATLLRDDLGDQLAAGPSESLQQQVLRLGEQTQTRFTLVKDDGVVLADSEQPNLDEVAKMENHLGRKEFAQAKHHGFGISRRDSPTLGESFLYFALAVKEGEQIVGYVRAAQSIGSIQEEATTIRRLIWLVGLLVGLSGLVITYGLTLRILRPVQALTTAAEEVAQGAYPDRIEVRSEDEFGTLARSFERMSRELRLREVQLKSSLHRQQAVLGGMIEGVLAVDARQRVMFANPAAEKALSFHSESVEGRPLLEVVRSHELREIVVQTFRSGQLCQRDISLQGPAARTFNVHATPLPGEPSPGVVLVLHDVTELKRLEGLRQEFVANVSHELKTPLSSIKAYTETLLNGAIEDEQNAERFLHRIDDQADRLNELILDMLSLARIESGSTSFEMASVPLSRVVAACLESYESRFAAAKVALRNELGPDEVLVRADEESLFQVLSNLIDNAIKYTPEEGVVSIRCQADGDKAVIEVSDTGVGIASEHQERLFERFYRVDKARSRELGGTGLGLSIVKHLCQSMGGRVSVESEVGRGSTFRVRLPLA
ncbi:MAG: HAMP domain-containing protein [Planctomycetales bacterium]|nr:HAMP domain-containing protein [Planctomycetales bacterium]